MKWHLSFILRFHIKIFHALGYCTINFRDNPSPRTERWLRLWSFLLLVFFNICALVALFCHTDVLYTGDRFGLFNDILKVVFGNIAVTTSYIETILKHSHVYRFWLIYSQLQEKTNKNYGEKFSCLEEIRRNRRFLTMFYVTLGSEIVVTMVFFHYQIIDRQLLLFWSFFSPFVYMVHLRNMQFIFHIELIRQELVKLQEDLALMVYYSRCHAYGAGFRGFKKFLRSKIAEKQKFYELIYEMLEIFQNSFGFSIIGVILMIYVRTLVDSYFVYYSTYVGWQKYGTGNILEIRCRLILLVIRYIVSAYLLYIPSLMQIPMFLITSKCCMDVVSVCFVSK